MCCVLLPPLLLLSVCSSIVCWGGISAASSESSGSTSSNPPSSPVATWSYTLPSMLANHQGCQFYDFRKKWLIFGVEILTLSGQKYSHQAVKNGIQCTDQSPLDRWGGILSTIARSVWLNQPKSHFICIVDCRKYAHCTWLVLIDKCWLVRIV